MDSTKEFANTVLALPHICIATFKSLIKRQDESVWDELYQPTLTLAKLFDIDI
jgi:hypothetical protein